MYEKTDPKTLYEHHYDVAVDNKRKDVATQVRRNKHSLKQWMKKCLVVMIVSSVLLNIVLSVIIVFIKTKIDEHDECNKPPNVQDGKTCEFESQEGRTIVRYSSLTKQNIDTFDHCPVSHCHARNDWSMFKVSSSVSECYNESSSGTVYKGKITCTVTGRTCQRWDRDYPQKRNRNHIPENSEDLHSNYCRDPGPPYERAPWCYTTDSKVRWEFCHVPLCGDLYCEN